MRKAIILFMVIGMVGCVYVHLPVIKYKGDCNGIWAKYQYSTGGYLNDWNTFYDTCGKYNIGDTIHPNK